MRNYQMLIFFSIVLFVYSAGNVYLYSKGWHALPVLQKNKLIYSIVFILLAAVFIIAKIIEARHSSILTDVLNVMGGFWLAFMLYGFIFFMLSDIIYLLLKIPGVVNERNAALYRKWAFFATLSVSTVLIIGGFINAIIPVVKEYKITINKPADGMKSIRVAAVSDIHLGSIIRKRSMIKLSSMLAELRPDLVLLLGDIVDGEIGPVMRGDLLQHLTCPKCELGMLAITGNHEFIGGAQHTIPYIESKGIRLLNDEMMVLKGGIQLIGRKDRDSERFYGTRRLALDELMTGVDTTKPVIVLDHQPVSYDEPVKQGIDLQLSGHTHNGQMWPLNHITRLVFENSYGYMKRGKSQFIVSSGFGLWGPRVRSASRSEVMLIEISFNGNSGN
jgi:uncharacterized protein